MTEAQARTTANVLLGIAAVGAAYLIVRHPPARRMAWEIVRTALTGAVPVWLGTELRQGWNDSAPVVARRP